MQRIGIVAESHDGETRVAATPATVRQLMGLGFEVVVAAHAGAKASFTDAEYVKAGAEIVDGDEAWRSDIVMKVNAPSSAEAEKLADGATLISLISPALNPGLLETLSRGKLTVLAMDAVPRISRAQSLDVLSSMANIAGYRAVVEAAHAFGRFFSGQVTAAGKVPPAKVLVAGAGVAGLAAIGAAKSLGAIVRATDPRPEVAEQVRSLGGEFLTVQSRLEASTDGYAKATSSEYDLLAEELYAQQAADVDIIVTTALIPGRPAPRLISAGHVASMRAGSVIVDMAAGQGGNVEGSVAGQAIVTANGVTIIGYTDLPGRLPAQASQLYGTNLVNLMKLLTPAKDGQIAVDFDDVVLRSMTVVHQGEKTWPPPPVAVSATPTATATSTPPPVRSEPAKRGFTLAALALAALFGITAVAPAQLSGNLTVFVLAIVIGFYVVGKVHHALHTPLMSVTNAISGIVVIGAMLQFGQSPLITLMSFLAIVLASINIFGGFAVTRRMLSMFSRE